MTIDVSGCWSEAFSGMILVPYWITVLAIVIAFPLVGGVWKWIHHACSDRCCPAAPRQSLLPSSSASTGSAVAIVPIAVQPSNSANAYGSVSSTRSQSKPAEQSCCYRFTHFICTFDATFLLAQTLFQLFHFLYIIATVSQTLPDASAAPLFHRYEHVYIRWISGGGGGGALTIAYVWFAVVNAWAIRMRHRNASLATASPTASSDELPIPAPETWRVRNGCGAFTVTEFALVNCCAAIVFAIALPITITHVFPMTVSLFVWTVPLIGGLSSAMTYILIVFVTKPTALTSPPTAPVPAAPAPDAAATTTTTASARIQAVMPVWVWRFVPIVLIVLRTAGVLSLVASYQATTNYGTLWYSGGSECTYAQVIVSEWHMHPSITASDGGANEYFQSIHDLSHQRIAFLSLIL